MTPFTTISPSDWVASDALAFAVRDAYPVSPGHTLVVTRRVVPDWFAATDEERRAVMELVGDVKRRLDRGVPRPHPDGYNVGFNAGSAAGQTVAHLHVHVIPRYAGDMDDPRVLCAGMVGLTPGERLWEHQIAPRLDDHMGPVFEDVCRAFVRRTDRLPFAPLRVGDWWDAGSRNQIDVVAIGPAGELLLGECKWGKVRVADVERLRARADLIVREHSDVGEVRFAVFSGGGLAPEVQAEVEAGRVLHFSAESLYGS